jgi:hypothetical protein
MLDERFLNAWNQFINAKFLGVILEGRTKLLCVWNWFLMA